MQTGPAEHQDSVEPDPGEGWTERPAVGFPKAFPCLSSWVLSIVGPWWDGTGGAAKARHPSFATTPPPSPPVVGLQGKAAAEG